MTRCPFANLDLHVFCWSKLANPIYKYMSSASNTFFSTHSRILTSLLAQIKVGITHWKWVPLKVVGHILVLSNKRVSLALLINIYITNYYNVYTCLLRRIKFWGGHGHFLSLRRSATGDFAISVTNILPLSPISIFFIGKCWLLICRGRGKC